LKEHVWIRPQSGAESSNVFGSRSSPRIGGVLEVGWGLCLLPTGLEVVVYGASFLGGCVVTFRGPSSLCLVGGWWGVFIRLVALCVCIFCFFAPRGFSFGGFFLFFVFLFFFFCLLFVFWGRGLFFFFFLFVFLFFFFFFVFFFFFFFLPFWKARGPGLRAQLRPHLPLSEYFSLCVFGVSFLSSAAVFRDNSKVCRPALAPSDDASRLGETELHFFFINWPSDTLRLLSRQTFFAVLSPLLLFLKDRD